MKPISLRSFLILATTSLISSCENSGNQANLDLASTGKPTIAAANYPLAYFAERLSAEFAEVLFEPVPGTDPAYWEPTDNQVSSIQQADLILLNGAGYAQWTSSRTIPYETTVITSTSFEDAFIKLQDGIRHTHKRGTASHTHEGVASTTWLDLMQASAQASSTAEALIEQFPEHSDSVSRELESLLTDLGDLDRQMRTTTAPLRGADLVVSHPVYQYWARAYELSAHSLHWEPTQELGASEMSELAATRTEGDSARYFIWETQPSQKNLDKIKAAGFINIVVNPCGGRPANGDFLKVMRENISSLAQGITQGASTDAVEP